MRIRFRRNDPLRAVKFLFLGPAILLLLLVINLMTWNGHWWAQWAGLGIGIAWLINLLRVLKLVIVAGGLAALGAYLYRRRVRARFRRLTPARSRRRRSLAVRRAVRRTAPAGQTPWPYPCSRSSSVSAAGLTSTRTARFLRNACAA
jgi:hypothetical protein